MRIAILVPDDRDELRRYADADPYFGPAPTALLEGLAKMPECEVHIVCAIQKPLRSPRKLADNIYYHSVMVRKWGWMRGAYLGCILAIRKKLREIKPDLVHGQGTERYCALAAVLSGYPSVLTLHGNMRQLAKISRSRPFSFPWLAARLEQFALPRSLGVFCNSHHTQRLVSGVAAATWLVPNALRGSFFPAPTAIQPSLPPVLLNIGVIGPNKSQNEILDVAARLRRRQAAFELHFIGRLDESLPYGRRFLARIQEAEKEGYARYLGQKSEADLIGLMDSASGLIHAPAEEAFGLVVAEGLARNLKLFGARVGGVVDIAAGTEGAELFEPGMRGRWKRPYLNGFAPGIQNQTKRRGKCGNAIILSGSPAGIAKFTAKLSAQIRTELPCCLRWQCLKSPTDYATDPFFEYQARLTVNIQEAQHIWNELGQDDPMWAVLTDADKKGGKWTAEQFFQTGREEVGQMVKKLEDSGIDFQRGKALDFGCGLGRLSQALSNYFSSVDGVDISASMIEKARAFNKAPEKVCYHLNPKADLGLFPSASFDFIFTRICLQHITPRHQLAYISEFMRLLKPGGIAHFQTIHAHGPRALVPDWFTEIYRKFKHRGKAFIPMYGVPTRRVLGAIKAGGGVVKAQECSAYEGRWESRFRTDNFVVIKPKF